MTFSQFRLIHTSMRFGGVKSEPEVIKVKTWGNKVKKWFFPNLADSGCYGVQGLKSEPEVNKVKTWGYKVKNDLFPILADSCSYGVWGPQKSIWGHRGQNLRAQGQKMTFSQLWLIRAPMGSRGLKSESVIPKSAKVLQSWKFVILTISGLGCNMYFLKELWRYCFHRRSIIVCLQKYGQFNLGHLQAKYFYTYIWNGPYCEWVYVCMSASVRVFIFLKLMV